MDNEAIERWLEERRESMLIRCPHCGWVFDDDESFCVSYHGSRDKGGPYEIECCGACEKTFFVNEEVARTYESYKTRDEALEN